MRGYATTDQTFATASSEVAGPTPLTNKIMSSTNEHLDLARQTAQRLFELRDRLFGANPPDPRSNNADGAKAPASGFAEAYAGQSRELYEYLSLIDGVSMELANRL